MKKRNYWSTPAIFPDGSKFIDDMQYKAIKKELQIQMPDISILLSSVLSVWVIPLLGVMVSFLCIRGLLNVTNIFDK